MTSHEFFESVSDPLLNAWSSSGNEIGDNCNPGGRSYPARRKQCHLERCEVRGPRDLEQLHLDLFPRPAFDALEIATGGDDLRDDSSATVSALSNLQANLQIFTLKRQNQPGFGNNTSYQQMFGFNGTSTPEVGSVSITLTSHNSLFETDDNWKHPGHPRSDIRCRRKPRLSVRGQRDSPDETDRIRADRLRGGALLRSPSASSLLSAALDIVRQCVRQPEQRPRRLWKMRKRLHHKRAMH